MPPIPQRFAIPTSDDDFEEMCLQLLRRHWSRSGLEIFGKRGERQYGIDILDVAGEIPIYAAQCKLKEEHKSLRPAEIQAEVDQARQFTPPLGKYGILTTGKVSAQAQRKVREINHAHRTTGLFEVEVMTWERLCSLLQQYPEAQEQFYGEIAFGRATRMEAELLTIKQGVESLTSKSDGDEVDSQINEARDCITKRDFQVAILLLNLIQRNKGERLTPRQKFRILSNHGAAELGLGRANTAAKFFLEAVSLQPDDEQGRTNEVLAHLLVGDLTTAHARASLLRTEYPGSSRLAAFWLITAPKEVPLAVLEGEITSVLLTDAEVSLALARRALMERSFDIAFKHADSSVRAAPKWSQARLVLGQISLGRALNSNSELQKHGGLRHKLVLEAEEAYSKALDLARTDRDDQTQKAALILRVDARLLLKKNSDATKDAEDAQELDPDNSGVMLAVAQVRFSSGQIEEGISILSKACDRDPQPHIGFVYAKALHDRGRSGDQDKALDILLGISLRDFAFELRPAVVTQVIQLLAKKKDWTAADVYLDKVSELLDNIVLKIFQGYLAHYQGLPGEAELRASEARSFLAPDVNADTREYLARLLMLIGRPADALPLWQELFDLEPLQFDPGNLLNCAAKLHRDDVVMQTCDRLHERGVNDWNLIDFEIQYLQKYNINAAIERLQAFIVQQPDHKVAQLRLSLIGLLLNRPELVKSAPEDLPSVDDLPLEYVLSAVQVIKLGGDPTRAVDYAYRFLRENFNELEAHRALIMRMMPGSFSPEIPPTLDVVEIGAAVCYQELPNGNITWAVLEQTDTPSGDFEEIPSTSTLAVELTGKRVDETAIIARGTIQNRVARIMRILPKYVRRFQDSMSEMQVRFGPASSVESVQVGLSAEEGDQHGLAPILASIERRAAAVDEVRDFYKSGHVSLHMYGARFGENAYGALVDLARENDQQVRCSLGTSEERSQAIHYLQTAKALVIDITALATLRLIGLTKILSSTKYKFIVPQRTWVTFHEKRSEAQLFSAPGGTLLYEKGRHVMFEETLEEKQERNRQDEDFIRLIEGATEVRSGIGLAALEPSKRETLEKLFGTYGAEAMVLASHPDYVLWTDDLVHAQVAAQEFGIRRAWTQIVLGSLADAGLLTSEEYDEASARLIAMEFVTTLFGAPTMLAGIRLSQWSCEKPPAYQFVKIFADPSGDLQTLIGIYANFTERLYREPIAPTVRCSVTRAFLDALGRRPGGMIALKSLRSLSSRVFGINAIGQKQFDECFDLWLTHGSGPLIV